MKTSKISSKSKNLSISVLIAIFLLGGYALFLALSPSSPKQKALAMANVKQIGTGLLIYAGYHDGHFPIATSSPGLRGALVPYVKEQNPFIPVKNYATTPTFNFNLAGASQKHLPIGEAENFDLDSVVSAYSVINKPSSPEQSVMASRLDSSAKTISMVVLMKSLEYQFDRTGVTLAPPDYLADQDPLKNSR